LLLFAAVCGCSAADLLLLPASTWMALRPHGCDAPVYPHPSPVKPRDDRKSIRRLASLLAHLRGQSRPDRPLALHHSQDLRFEDRICCIGSFATRELRTTIDDGRARLSSPPTSVAPDRPLARGGQPLSTVRHPSLHSGLTDSRQRPANLRCWPPMSWCVVALLCCCVVVFFHSSGELHQTRLDLQNPRGLWVI
jgi:hypothetical protein